MISNSHTRYFHYKFLQDDLKNVKGNLLDVGCGDGWILDEIQKRNLKLNGCDIDKKKNFNFKFKKCSAENLDYKDKSFDFVIMTDVLEHLKKPNAAITEISRVLKKGGKFHLVVPLEKSLFTIDGWIQEVFGINLKKDPIGHIQQFKFKDIKNMLDKNDLKVNRVEYSYYFIYQFLSLLYFSYVEIFKNGKYVNITPASGVIYSPKIFNKMISVGSKMINLESYVFNKLKIPGQTVHITVVKF